MFRTAKDTSETTFKPATISPLPADQVKREPVHPEPVRPQIVTPLPVKAEVAPTTVRIPATATAVQAPRPVAPSAPPRAVEATIAAPSAPPVRAPEKPARPANAAPSAVLVAGPGVMLKGNMQCEVLRIEGNVEGDVKARKLLILAGGTLVGTAEVEEAEIEGHFEGSLAVANLLVVRTTGRLSGKFQYGEIEIERGGAVSGEIVAQSSASVRRSTEPAVVPHAVRS